MTKKLAIIQRSGVFTDSDWNDIEGATNLLGLLFDRGMTCVLIWRGTTKTKEGRIEDVFKPYSKLAARLKNDDARLSGAIFIDADTSSSESQLEPQGNAIKNALSQFQTDPDDVVMIACEPMYVDAANHLGIDCIAPENVVEWLNRLAGTSDS